MTPEKAFVNTKHILMSINEAIGWANNYDSLPIQLETRIEQAITDLHEAQRRFGEVADMCKRQINDNIKAGIQDAIGRSPCPLW